MSICRRNKFFYFIAALCLFSMALISGFNSYSFLKKLNGCKSRLEQQKVSLNQEAEILKKEIRLLGTPEEIERIARQSYSYVRDDEVIYIVK